MLGGVRRSKRQAPCWRSTRSWSSFPGHQGARTGKIESRKGSACRSASDPRESHPIDIEGPPFSLPWKVRSHLPSASGGPFHFKKLPSAIGLKPASRGNGKSLSLWLLHGSRLKPAGAVVEGSVPPAKAGGKQHLESD